MWRFYAAVALGWLALTPPLFTGGACSGDIKLLMRYDERGQLIGFNSDMAPFKSLQIPFTTTLLHWGR
jgi:hypothetical protein